MAGSRNIADPNNWFVATASVAGTKHVRKNQPNQDALRYRTLPGTDHLVAVIADGAGSAPMSRQGAMVATEMALEFAWDTLTRQPAQDLTSLLASSISAAREKVLQTAEEAELPARDFATTLLAFIQANGQSAAAQIGDGACVVAVNEAWSLATEPQRGEHANETSFITQDNAILKMSLSPIMPNICRVMLCTDGMMHLTLQQPGNTPHPPYFDGTFAWLESCSSQEKACRQMSQLLLSGHVRRLTDDDLTMFQGTLLHSAEPPSKEP